MRRVLHLLDCRQVHQRVVPFKPDWSTLCSLCCLDAHGLAILHSQTRNLDQQLHVINNQSRAICGMRRALTNHMRFGVSITHISKLITGLIVLLLAGCSRELQLWYYISVIAPGVMILIVYAMAACRKQQVEEQMDNASTDAQLAQVNSLRQTDLRTQDRHEVSTFSDEEAE